MLFLIIGLTTILALRLGQVRLSEDAAK